MQRTPEGPGSEDPARPAADDAARRPSGRQLTGAARARRSAATAAAMAVLGTSAGLSSAHAVEPAEAPAPAERRDGVDGPSRTVQAGDSLWSVAVVNGIAVDELMDWNDLRGDASITPGDTLRLSAPSEDPKTDRSTREEADRNGADRDGTGRDEAARVADPSPAAEPDPDAPATEAEPGALEHEIAAGDSLWGLALRHEVSVETILRANDLDVAAPLRPGRMLRIPEAAPAAPRTAEKAAEEDPEKATGKAPGKTSEARGDGGRPQVVNDFPGYDYDDETLASANRHLERLHERPAPSAADLQTMIATTAESMGVDPALALAHAEQESGFDHRRVSPADAVGTMQVIPASGEWAEGLVGRDLDLLDPQDNVTAGVAIMRENLEITSTREQAIGAYYQGAHGIEEYGMYTDTKTYVREVRAKLEAWQPRT